MTSDKTRNRVQDKLEGELAQVYTPGKPIVDRRLFQEENSCFATSGQNSEVMVLV